MKGRQLTDTQVIAILREAGTGQTTIEALCRKPAIGEATFYRWQSKYGGMDVSDAARLKELEREYTRLNKLRAEQDLESKVIKEFNVRKW